jgi:hypothetical protein
MLEKKNSNGSKPIFESFQKTYTIAGEATQAAAETAWIPAAGAA